MAIFAKGNIARDVLESISCAVDNVLLCISIKVCVSNKIKNYCYLYIDKYIVKLRLG